MKKKSIWTKIIAILGIVFTLILGILFAGAYIDDITPPMLFDPAIPK